jgi:hypothetical protein
LDGLPREQLGHPLAAGGDVELALDQRAPGPRPPLVGVLQNRPLASASINATGRPSICPSRATMLGSTKMSALASSSRTRGSVRLP